ncbi:MAG: TlpA family protein disulfide reductase [Weeksellaceae bacterium]
MRKYLILAASIFMLGACDNKLKSESNVLNPAQDKNVVKEATINNANEAPSFMDVDLKGYQTPDINLNQFYGEVVFINFWGSWCPPCRIEMPSIQALYDDYGDKVKFAMIAFEKEHGKHIEFINENGYTFPVYEAISPMDSELKPQGFPTTLLVDKKGNILMKDIGARDWNSQEFREQLNELLAQ